MERNLKTKQLRRLSWLGNSKARIICETVIIIFYIRKEFANLSELWELFINKAQAWVEKKISVESDRAILEGMVHDRWRSKE